MAKPAGARCNLRCGYCYYLGKETLPRRAPGRMNAEILERFIAQRIAAAGDGGAHFEWHGGEPTVLGLDYFRGISRIQKKHRRDGRVITNGIQTNGLLINEAWADFFARESWSVGLSLDGPAGVHDAMRVAADGKPTHGRVLHAFRALVKRGVFVNVLCVLNKANAGQPEETYGFFRDIGVRYLQFLPLVTPASGGLPHPAAAEPQVVGEFLCRVFDAWVSEDVGRIVIQTFDEALRPLYGMPHALCIHRETCGAAAVLERDGGIYACDHFVDPGHRIGSIMERSLDDLMEDPRMAAFGAAKAETLSRACRACAYLAFCNGGCPKDRIVADPGGGFPLNYLCPAYLRFFAHARPALEKLAIHMKAGKPLKDFRNSGGAFRHPCRRRP